MAVANNDERASITNTVKILGDLYESVIYNSKEDVVREAVQKKLVEYIEKL